MAHRHEAPIRPAWWPASSSLARGAGWRSRGRTSRSGSKAPTDTLLERTATSTTTGTVTKDGSAAHPCAATAPPARSRPRRAATGRRAGRRSATTSPDDPAARRTRPRPATRRARTGRSGSTTSSRAPAVCGTPMQDGDDVLFFPSCFGRAKEPTRCGSPGSRPSAAQGQVVQRARRRVRRDVRPEFNATTTSAPAAGAAVNAGGQRRRGRRRHRARHGRRAGRGRRARGEGRLRALGDRAGVRALRHDRRRRARRARPTPSGAARRRWASRTARCSRARRRRGRCAATVAADPSGLVRRQDPPPRKDGKKCSFFSGGRERFRKTHRAGTAPSSRSATAPTGRYLLPKRLGRGRYGSRPTAIDGALQPRRRSSASGSGCDEAALAGPRRAAARARRPGSAPARRACRLMVVGKARGAARGGAGAR